MRTPVQTLVDTLLKGKSPKEQIKTLRDLFEIHAFGHPWVDDDTQESIIENVCQAYEIPKPDNET